MERLEREITISIQFCLLLFFALVGAWVWGLPNAPINLKEAWRNFAPYINSVILIFIILSVLRLGAIYLLNFLLTRIVKSEVDR
jgi:hypothetical protein